MGTHMWSSAQTSRRGRRMSLDLPHPPIPLTAKDSEFLQRRPELFFPYLQQQQQQTPFSGASLTNGFRPTPSDLMPFPTIPFTSCSGQPLPPTLGPFKPGPEVEGVRPQSPEQLRVRSPQTLQRMAFDIATLKQSYHSNPDEDEEADEEEEEEEDVLEDDEEANKTPEQEDTSNVQQTEPNNSSSPVTSPVAEDEELASNMQQPSSQPTAATA